MSLQPTKDQRSDTDYDGLKEWQFYAYGVGHLMNDLGGAIYFNYLLYFLKRIVGTKSAPGAFLAGQIIDGLATPVVGFLSDRTHTRYGQRKPWYVGGFIVFLIGYFPMYQNIKRLYPEISEEGQTAYYILFMCIINIGWAAVQIGHMSLVPSLTYSIERRVMIMYMQDRLNNKRNSFTFLSNLIILGLGIILFATMNNPSLQISMLSYIAAAIGIPAGLFFIIGINEVKLSKIASEKLNQLARSSSERTDTYRKLSISDEQLGDINQKDLPWTHWFTMPAFYIFGFCYMGVRLYCNLFGTLLPFYLVDVLEIGNKEQIKNNEIPFQVALVGLILYLSQYIVSLFTIKIYTKFGRKKTLFAGLTLCFGTSLTMVFINPWSSGVMYAIAVFIGIAETLVLSTGINLISDVVGLKSKKGALVFGVYSFADKFASGLAIYFITVSPLFESSVSFKKWTIILIPSLACILSCTMVLLSPVKEYNQQPPPDTVALKLNSSDIDLVI